VKLNGFGIPVLIAIALIWAVSCNADEPVRRLPNPLAQVVVSGWQKMAGNRAGKVIYGEPPKMMVLDLQSGVRREIPGIVTAGFGNRRRRGRSPRPSWAPDGRRFVYRFNGAIFVSDLSGRKKEIFNELMATGDETRWTWFYDGQTDWLAGPSKVKTVILVKVSDPSIIETVYAGNKVVDHCELTGSGKYVVYDDGSDIYVSPVGGNSKGLKISTGQSCRPCASPDDRVAWLTVPHVKYLIFDALDGRFLSDLHAPPGEELYRLNWSNHPDFAVHMFGSNGNERMHVRLVGNGGYLYIGNGWDPDLWVGAR